MNKNNDIVVKNGQKLRCGYTTGSCATAATAAATQMILSGQRVDHIKIMLPNSNEALFEVNDINIGENFASCSVQKDAGDDPDVTDGIRIFSKVMLCDKGIHIKGGKGVGLVTSKGLQCEVGEPAINPVPKKMITQNAQKICEKYSYDKGLEITISAQNGEEIAKKTFNPRLGIVGGISILGTTGIVEPMSEKALIDTIKVLIDKQKVKNEKLILISPGNYGRDYCKNVLHFDIDKGIKFSNYIGETLDYLVYSGFEKVLLVGHIGKLVKIAGGIMNTHSSYADCRMEILAAHSAMAGATSVTIKQIMNCKTTDEAIEIIEKAGLKNQVFASIKEKIQFHIDYRTKGKMQVEFYIFSTDDSIITQTENADEFAKEIRGIEDESEIL
ncbi:cobalt-precorrin-5B (C(1))-methyltransferase CbiD [Paludicola sp. MB14-C6]|uniref:cobalt-precorrin-5B (C(1))-methyltransferase CbiD n=1 Tax=Paludihabitans sp. MB14-C6 TaxID=3070656 RepID=UPI0027DE4252|nr:cobalt-precorrin-5B (C(1))-methyltransferase CbiD [Paludicola sp. MB14-C6]WMJ22030.1 cobalt-precorrin-5B (C(1))-methyltransferase CbiD [Paludicola sp. MB14-C6]